MKVTTIGPNKTTDQRPLVEHPSRHSADRSCLEGPGTADGPFSVPPPCVVPRRRGDIEWTTWFRDIGRQMRALREFLGLSQDQLATLAGVSQGAVSRFETGRGRFTPAVVVLKLAVGLAAHCRARGHAVLSAPLARMLDDLEECVPRGGGRALPAIAREREAEELQRLFNAAPAPARGAALAVLRSFLQDQVT